MPALLTVGFHHLKRDREPWGAGSGLSPSLLGPQHCPAQDRAQALSEFSLTAAPECGGRGGQRRSRYRAGPIIENLTRERGWLLKEKRMPVLLGMGDPTVHRTGLDLDPELRVEWGS